MENRKSNPTESLKLNKQKEIISKVFEAFETGNTSDLEKYVAPGYKENIPDPTFKSTGIQLLKDKIKLYNSAFPDLKIKVNEFFGEGDIVCIHSTITGTNKGIYHAGPPTDKKIKINSIDIVTFANDRLTEHTGILD